MTGRPHAGSSTYMLERNKFWIARVYNTVSVYVCVYKNAMVDDGRGVRQETSSSDIFCPWTCDGIQNGLCRWWSAFPEQKETHSTSLVPRPPSLISFPCEGEKDIWIFICSVSVHLCWNTSALSIFNLMCDVSYDWIKSTWYDDPIITVEPCLRNTLWNEGTSLIRTHFRAPRCPY